MRSDLQREVDRRVQGPLGQTKERGEEMRPYFYKPSLDSLRQREVDRRVQHWRDERIAREEAEEHARIRAYTVATFVVALMLMILALEIIP